MSDFDDVLGRQFPPHEYKTTIFLYSSDEKEVEKLYEEAILYETESAGDISEFARLVFGERPDNFPFHGGLIEEIKPVEKRGDWSGFEISSRDDGGCSAAFWAKWVDDFHPSCRIAYATGSDETKMYSSYDPDNVCHGARFRLKVKDTVLGGEYFYDVASRDAFCETVEDFAPYDVMRDIYKASDDIKDDARFFEDARIKLNVSKSPVEIAVYRYNNCSPHGVNIFVPKDRYGFEKD